jgi:diguanylate cyclase (GGDEF)-like protein
MTRAHKRLGKILAVCSIVTAGLLAGRSVLENDADRLRAWITPAALAAAASALLIRPRVRTKRLHEDFEVAGRAGSPREAAAPSAERDNLTGLPNRARFHQELHCLLGCIAAPPGRLALLKFDIDHFRCVNGSLGPAAGDHMLVRLVSELKPAIPNPDRFFRLGDDEFAVLLEDASVQDAQALGGRLVRAIGEIAFEFESTRLRLTASLGIAAYPAHARDAREMVVHADAAMRRAKAEGRNGCQCYDAARDSSGDLLSQLSLEQTLDVAIEKGGLRIAHQGIYHQDGRLSHLEALVRIADSADPGTLLSPGIFMPLAERTGRIRVIDQWVVRETIAQLARAPHIPAIAVNVSGRSIDDCAFAGAVRAELEQSGIDPGRLIIELTETASVGDLEQLKRFAAGMREAGCRICLDDFGSGFSSFTYLKHLDAQILKIDGAFIRELLRDATSRVLVQAIVAVAESLDKVTVAEYVEDLATLELLRETGVDLFQGFLFDRPSTNHAALRKKDDRRLALKT